MRKPDLEREINGGIQRIYHFDNGWGASVVRHIFSYGRERGLWELAVIKYYGTGILEWQLNYDHPESCGDVVGSLTDSDVDNILANIEATPPNEDFRD